MKYEENVEDEKLRRAILADPDRALALQVEADRLEELGAEGPSAAYRAMGLWEGACHLVDERWLQLLGIASVEVPGPPKGLGKLVEAEGRDVVLDTLLVLVPARVSLAQVAQRANDWCAANGRQPAVRPDVIERFVGLEDEANEARIRSPRKANWVVLEMEPKAGLAWRDEQALEELLVREPYRGRYDAASPHAALLAAVGHYLQSGERLWDRRNGWQLVRCRQGLLLGNFAPDGLGADVFQPGLYEDISWALSRKLA